MPLLHLRGGDKSTLAESIDPCRADDDRATKCGLCERGNRFMRERISIYQYKYMSCLLSGANKLYIRPTKEHWYRTPSSL